MLRGLVFVVELVSVGGAFVLELVFILGVFSFLELIFLLWVFVDNVNLCTFAAYLSFAIDKMPQKLSFAIDKIGWKLSFAIDNGGWPKYKSLIIMQRLNQRYRQFIDDTALDFTRYLYKEINWRTD